MITGCLNRLKKLISLITLFAYLAPVAVSPLVYAAEFSDLPDMGYTASADGTEMCKPVGKVCVEKGGKRMVDGFEIERDCWREETQYTCVSANPTNVCQSLDSEKTCEAQIKNCLKSDDTTGLCLQYEMSYSCDKPMIVSTGITQLPGSHLITTDWDNTACRAADSSCAVAATKCVEGKATKIINGVSVTRDCWAEERTLQCLGSGTQSDECGEHEQNPNCRLQSEKCTFAADNGVCQIREKTYTCSNADVAGEHEADSCTDPDFAKTMTSMELARELSRFFDPKNQRFFNGEPNFCSVKLDGALDGLLGGNCCETDAEVGSMNDFTKQAGTQLATNYLLQSVGSHYTFSTLTGQAASYLATSVTSAAGLTAASGYVAAETSIGAFGFTATFTSSGSIAFAFNPATFAIAIAIMALQNWLSCGQADTLTAMKRKAGLCVYVGAYCDKKALGACVKNTESQCCFVSKLAKIFAVEGRKQLKRGWGDTKSPDCSGFLAQEIEKLDFSKMDLSEFYGEIVSNMQNVHQQSTAAQQRAQENVQSGSQQPANYYDRYGN